MGHLYVDVTRLIDRRTLTGIPRVMNEISTRFLERGDCTLVAWNGKSYAEVGSDRFAAWQQSRRQHQDSRRERNVQILLQLSARVVSKAKRTVMRFSDNDIHPNFRMGDVLLVGWGVWYDLAYISELERLQRSGVALVEFAYDLLPLVAPQYFSNEREILDRYVRRIYPLCELVFAISEHTRADVESWLAGQGLPAPLVTVIRLGEDFQVTEPRRPSNDRFRESGLKGSDFILCVGTIEPRKNHGLLIYVYKLARRRGLPLPSLVVVGRKGWMSDSVYSVMTVDPEIKDQFVLQEDTTDEELSWLYQNCLFTIYPSLCEGWGLPIAESLAHGAPCIASNTSSLPEIAGDLISYFSPVSTDECLAAIQSLLEPGGLDAARLRIRDYEPTAWDEAFNTIAQHVGALLRSSIV